MATTNLLSQSLGDVFIQSGDGTPDHSAPKGSTYFLNDGANIYKNEPIFSGTTDSSSLRWTPVYNQQVVSSSSSGATSIPLTNANTFYIIGTVMPWVTNSTNGFLVGTGGTLTYTGVSANFLIDASIWLKYRSTLGIYAFGVSAAGSTPLGAYSWVSLYGTSSEVMTSVTRIVTLISGDTVYPLLACTTAGAVVDVNNISITISVL